jgi:hypothetical protein
VFKAVTLTCEPKLRPEVAGPMTTSARLEG